MVFEVYKDENKGNFVAFTYLPNAKKKITLRGQHDSISEIKEVTDFIRPELNSEVTYSIATVNCMTQQLYHLPCQPKPIITKDGANFDSSREFDIYVNDSENKLWAIAIDGTGDILYMNDNTEQCMVYQAVDLSLKSQSDRVQEKVNKGYKLVESKHKFDLGTFHFIPF